MVYNLTTKKEKIKMFEERIENVNFLVDIYNQKKSEYKSQENDLKYKQDELKRVSESIINSLRTINRKSNLEWFVKNFDWIYKNRKMFAIGTCYANIIIDFLTFYSECHGMFGGINPLINKLPLEKLVKLWDNGYEYKGIPLIGFKQKGREHYGICSWIENGEIKTHNVENFKNYLPTTCYIELLDYNHRQPSDYEVYKTIDELKPFIK